MKFKFDFEEEKERRRNSLSYKFVCLLGSIAVGWFVYLMLWSTPWLWEVLPVLPLALGPVSGPVGLQGGGGPYADRSIIDLFTNPDKFFKSIGDFYYWMGFPLEEMLCIGAGVIIGFMVYVKWTRPTDFD